MADPIHDNPTCADSNAEEPSGWADRVRCLDGTIYGECGAEYCYGVCEDQGPCRCGCHQDPT